MQGETKSREGCDVKMLVFSVQEAPDALAEGVPCTFILVASHVRQAMRIISGGNTFPFLW